MAYDAELRPRTDIIDLDSADLAQMGSNPPVWVPAPGVGKALRFLALTGLTGPSTINFSSKTFDAEYAVSGRQVSEGSIGLSMNAGRYFQLSADDFESTDVVENQALRCTPGSDDPTGLWLTATVVNGGTGYAVDDLFDPWGLGDSSKGKVTAVSGGVVTAVQILIGTSPVTVGESDIPTFKTTGAGDDALTLEVATITPADGSIRIWITYQLLTLP